MRLVAILLPIFSLLMAILGCTGDSNPVNGNLKGSEVTEVNESLPIIGFDGSSAIGLFGAYTLAISPDDKTNVELVPIRTIAAGDSYIVSGAGFFTMIPCHDCLKIKSISLGANHDLRLGMSVKHPFAKGDLSKPPSGINRLDLDVFDLAMLVRPLEQTASSFAQGKVYSGYVTNADGYTTEMSQVLNDSAAIPYKICYENPDHNRFEMGCDYQDFEVGFAPSGAFNFQIYLTMGYGASAKKIERLNPTYYIPEFNRKSAWKVIVTPPQGDIPPERYNTWDDYDSTTNYSVRIDIYDWNHGGTIAGTYPDPADPSQIMSLSDVVSVRVEIPGMTSAPIEAITSDNTSNGWDDPVSYIAAFPNELGLARGSYTGIVKVLDSRAPGAIGGLADSLVNTPDGIFLNWYTLPEFATYQAFTATVVVGGDRTPPVWDTTTGITNVTPGHKSATVSWGTATDAETPPVRYLVYFDTDNQPWDQTPVVRDNNSPFTINGLNIGQTYWFGVRCQDSCAPPNADSNTIVLSAIPVDSQPPSWNSTTGITALSSGYRSLTIYWGTATDADSPPVSYLVYVDTNNNPWDQSPIVLSNNNPYTLSNLNNGVIYWVGVRCRDSASPPNVDTNGVILSAGASGYIWGDNVGSGSSEAETDIAIDGSGNVFICGSTYGNLYASQAGNGDFYLCKYYSDGSYVWGIQTGTTSYEEAYGVNVDSSGNVYLAGTTQGSIYAAQAGFGDAFLCKYNTNGSFQWGIQPGTTQSDAFFDLDFDSSNNLYVTGRTQGYWEVPNIGNADLLLCSYNSSGTPLWYRQIGTTQAEVGMGIEVGNYIYVCGFTGGSLFASFAGVYDAFVCNFTTGGSLSWGRQIGSNQDDIFYDVGVDSSNNVICVGETGGSLYSSLAGGIDNVMCKYNSSGTYQWGRQWGTAGFESASEIVVDSYGNNYVTGYSDGGIYNANNGGRDIFLCQYNSSGSVIWGYSWGSSGNDYGTAIDMNSSKYLALGGVFESASIDLDPYSATDWENSNGSSDAFLTKFYYE